MKNAFLYSPDTTGLIRAGSVFSVLSSVSRTAKPDPIYISHNYKAAHIIIDVTSVTGAAAITADIIGIGGASFASFIDQPQYTVLTGVTINAIGTTVLKIGPGLPGVANLTANDYMPPIFFVDINHANVEAIRYSVAVSLMD